MTAPAPPPLIAVIDEHADLVWAIALVLAEAGWRAATLISAADMPLQQVIDFIRAQQPAGCVYGVSPPYEAKWRMFQELREYLPDVPFVVVTTGRSVLARMANTASIVPIIEEPFELDEFIDAIARIAPLPPGAS